MISKPLLFLLKLAQSGIENYRHANRVLVKLYYFQRKHGSVVSVLDLQSKSPEP